MSVLTLLDLSAAFDTLDHSILLRRRETTFDICGMTLKWFDSYIRERFQSVVINGLQSKPALLQYGSPKDQCLVLFCLLCTRNQYHLQHKCGLHRFAYDTQVGNSALPFDFKWLTCILEDYIKEVKQRMTCSK